MPTSVVTQNSHLFSHLNVQIHNVTDQAPFLGRLWQTVKMVKEQNGYAAAAAVGSSFAIGTIYSLAFSYFCLEGTARSLQEADHSFKEKGYLSQSVGDAGGWLSLPLFSLITLNATLRKAMREGEFARIKPVCQEWYKQMRANTALTEIKGEELYSHINHILDEMAAQCFCYKSIVSRKLAALDILEGLEMEDQDGMHGLSELSLDQQLKSVYLEIEKRRNEALNVRNYFHRLKIALNTVETLQGASSRNWNIITGIACPMILSFATVCSAIGTPILGEKLFVQRRDLAEIGHFGEWPDNLIESAVVSYALNKDLLLKGDTYLLSCIFQEYLDTLYPTLHPDAGNKELYNRLCAVANEEIQQMKSTCFLYSSLNLNVFYPL
jgi:hypothetical protein